jgi:hypothetical protein
VILDIQELNQFQSCTTSIKTINIYDTKNRKISSKIFLTIFWDISIETFIYIKFDFFYLVLLVLCLDVDIGAHNRNWNQLSRILLFGCTWNLDFESQTQFHRIRL